MVQINMAAREIVLKIVYYGPALSGKTTNLQQLHAMLDPDSRGKMVTLDTKDDRTLYFDFLPIEFPTTSGFAVKLKVFTVPGQVMHKSTRKVVLAGADAGDLLDVRAKEAYRRRLAEIEEDLEIARRNHDLARAAQGEAEREFLLRELSRAVGLGGRDRRAGSASERARASVTRAVRQALARINACHPELGEHLDRTVRTGTHCSYQPDPRAPLGWKLSP